MEELNTVLFNLCDENREFKCDICNMYLSISPILYNNDVGNVCGRCHENGETKKFHSSVVFHRQTVYEKIAKYIVFPCSYRINGCKSELKWNEVQQHEERCDFKKINCLLSNTEITYDSIDTGVTGNGTGIIEQCDWDGNNNELVPHLKEHHDKYSSPSLQLKLISSEEYSNKIIFSTVLETFSVVIMYYHKNLGNYSCTVLMDIPFATCKMYRYDLEVLDNYEKRSIILPGNKVKPLSGIMCAQDMVNSLELDLKNINKLLNQPSRMILCFKINRIFEEKVELPNKESIEIDEQNNFFQGEKCFCGALLFPPIYTCINGHNCCERCKALCTGGKYNSASNCEKCKGAYLKGRNTTLETITTLATYPCRNSSRGCRVTVDYKQLKHHEENCTLTDKSCILKCDWKGTNSDMLQHVQEKHSPLYLNDVYLHEGCESNVIVFDQRIFHLNLNYKTGWDLSIKLQCLGMKQAEYEFEFTILTANSSIKLVTCHLCQPLLFSDGKEVDTPCISYPFDFFRQFLTDYSGFQFAIDIKKINSKLSETS